MIDGAAAKWEVRRRLVHYTLHRHDSRTPDSVAVVVACCVLRVPLRVPVMRWVCSL
jgi:hypothetical protein